MLKIIIIILIFFLIFFAVLLLLSTIKSEEKIRRHGFWFAIISGFVALLSAIIATNPKWLQNLEKKWSKKEKIS